jgi:hypothetical protein
MTPDSIAHLAARAMLDAFGSVGATTFDLTITDRDGEKVRFRRGAPLDNLRGAMPTELDRAAAGGQNVIVRPHGPAVVFIQLDDLSAAAVERVQEVAFLGLETSPRNYQAWVAMPATEADEDLARRLRKGVGADPTASGATRIAGSLNFKAKYAPDFPRVEIAHVQPGLIASKEKLAQHGLLAQEPRVPAHNAAPVRALPSVRKWPSYQRCIEGAPPTHGNTGPDVSRADFTWCLIALDWGWSVEATADRLMAESRKARQNGPRYALRTAERAAAVRRGVERPPASLSIQAPREGEFRPFLGASAKRGSPDAG